MILKNEAYVPKERQGSFNGNSGDPKVILLLFYGDQITVERTRGTMVLQSLYDLSLSRLEGFVPAVANWHARMTLVKVSKCCMHYWSY